MSLEKMELSPHTQEQKPENPELKLVNEQMKEAIKKEDYEQAAALRDFLNSQVDKNGEVELNKKDFIDPTPGGVYIFRKENPRHRAWKGIDAIRQKSYWDGNERITQHELADYFTSGPLTRGVLRDKDWKEIERMKDFRGGEKVDLMIRLEHERDDIKDIVNLSEEKFNNIWAPYRRKAGLFSPEYKELHSTYNDKFSLTDERIDNLNKVPTDIREPLNYWQRVYDNSRSMLDELNKALGELK